MKHIIPAALSLVLLLTACGQGTTQTTPTPAPANTPVPVTETTAPVSAETQPAESAAPAENQTAAQSNTLVVYFSHTGENYNVGTITEGNTAKVAKEIAAQTGADLFEIIPESAYPASYRECTDVAKAEQNAKARPTYTGDVENWEDYDTVYLGYPIWWGDLPMVVYTFLEGHDFAGKTVYPFVTHEGSGMSGTAAKIASTCTGSEVRDGLALRGSVAQNEAEEVSSQVNNWIGGN